MRGHPIPELGGRFLHIGQEVELDSYEGEGGGVCFRLVRRVN